MNGVVQTQAVTATVPENISSNQEAVPDVTGTYKGMYNGYPATALIEQYDGIYYAAVDFFLKDGLPPYVGNGVFENQWNRFAFSGDTLTFTDLTSGEVVAFVKMPD